MAHQATFRPKAKAKKLKPELCSIGYTVSDGTKKQMILEAEKLLRADGMSTMDFFKPDLAQIEKTPDLENDENQTGDQTLTIKEGSPAASARDAVLEGTDAADSDSVEHGYDIAQEIEDAVAALQPGQRYMRYNVPEDVYHASTGIGSSALREAFKSMAHYRTYCDDDKEISPQLQSIFNFGSAVHTFVLEPELYAERFAVVPSYIKSKASKDYKEWAAQIGDRIPLTAKENDNVSGIMKALLGSPKPAYLLNGGQSEVSFWYRDETNLILKARVDQWHDDGICVDLKTTKDAEPHAFAKTVRYDYRVQSALYKLVTGAADFVFVGVDKTAPYAHSMARVPAEIEELTRREMRAVVNQIAECMFTENWPSYDVDTIHEAEVWPSDIKKLEETQ